MDPREAIQFVTGSSIRPTVLRSVSEPAALNDLTATLSHSKKAISSALDWYEPKGWVQKRGDRYVQTAIGGVVLDQLDGRRTRDSELALSTTSAERVNEDYIDDQKTKREDLKLIANSRLRERMLRSSFLPASSSILSDEYKTRPPTAYRMLDSLESEGWFEKRGECYYRTDSGDSVLYEFEALLTVIKQALDNSECLRWLDRGLANLPVDHLTDAQKTVNSPEYPDAAEELFGELVNSEFDRYRGTTTYVSNSAARRFSPQIQDGVRSELLVTSSVLKNLPTAGNPAEMVKEGLRATNFDMLIASRLPVSLSIFDDEVVFICPRPQDVQGNEFGVLVSADDAVVEWAIDLYETYREQSRRPPHHIIHALLDRLDPSPHLAGLLSE